MKTCRHAAASLSLRAGVLLAVALLWIALVRLFCLRRFCSRAILLQRGQVAADGPADKVTAAYEAGEA